VSRYLTYSWDRAALGAITVLGALPLEGLLASDLLLSWEIVSMCMVRVIN
jgi:hypothetical protein